MARGSTSARHASARKSSIVSASLRTSEPEMVDKTKCSSRPLAFDTASACAASRMSSVARRTSRHEDEPTFASTRCGRSQDATCAATIVRTSSATSVEDDTIEGVVVASRTITMVCGVRVDREWVASLSLHWSFDSPLRATGSLDLDACERFVTKY